MSAVSLDIFHALSEIFTAHGWPIDEAPNKCFGKYVNMLNTLSQEEQLLMLDLTRNFQHIRIGAYMDLLAESVKLLIDKHPQISKYYVLPALADLSEVGKSSHTVQYLFKGDELYERLGLDPIRFRAIPNPVNFMSIGIKEGEKVLIVDDFIGTGGTMIDAINLYTGDGSLIKPKDIILLSLVAHKYGIEFLEKNGFSVYYAKQVLRGISDIYTGEKYNTYITLMKNIENRIPNLKDDTRFGYGQCEALLHMYRIPNNTFPIYWLYKGVSPYKR